MKKILLTLAVCFCALSVSAQDWAVGGRFGSGLQAQAEYHFSNNNYVEGRFGLYYATARATAMADFTALYNWNIFNMDWTPSVGQWFFDAGCGINVGGREYYAYLGAAGCAKLGLKLNDIPIRLAFDWTPAFGAGISGDAAFNKWGLCNFGISCVYCF